MDVRSKVLIVDDEQKNLDILSFALEDEFDIMAVSSGEAALECIEKCKPDIILLDIMMQGIDGYEVCRRIRASETHQFIKIILVSGKALPEERLQGYEVGADDYVIKPFDSDELIAKVRVFLKLKHAEEVDSIKGSFLALISHETNTPLNGVIGLSELLLDSPNLSDDDIDCVKMIYESGLRLQDLMDKSRLLCELQTGIECLSTSGEVYGVVVNAVQAAKERYGEDAKATIDIPRGLALKGDWRLLNTAITQLVDNAVKFSDDGGLVKVNARVEDNLCLLSFTDFGCGIDEGVLDDLFSAFWVGDVEHHNCGSGLSLAIVKEVVKLHRGGIAVESSSGKGTTFTVSLPLET